MRRKVSATFGKRRVPLSVRPVAWAMFANVADRLILPRTSVGLNLVGRKRK